MAALTPFTPLQVPNRELQLIQQQLQKTLAPVTANPLLTGVHVSASFPVVNQDVTVNHGLDSVNVGYIVQTQSLPGTVFTSPKTAATKNSITLQVEQASGTKNPLSPQTPMTCSIYVFLKGNS
jgi:hypothetical protein